MSSSVFVIVVIVHGVTGPEIRMLHEHKCSVMLSLTYMGNMNICIIMFSHATVCVSLFLLCMKASLSLSRVRSHSVA